MDRPEQMTERIIDYLYGELAEAERAKVEGLIASDPAWREEHARLAAVMGELDRLEGEELPAGLAEDMQARIAREELLERTATARVGGFLPIFTRVAAIAASALVVATLAWIIFQALPSVSAGPVEVIPQNVALTIFNDNLALVKDDRLIVNCPQGDCAVQFKDVAARIIADSVRFESHTDPAGTRVVEQNYEYDLATPEAVLKRYLDRDVTCVGKDGSVTAGKLLSFATSEFAPPDLETFAGQMGRTNIQVPQGYRGQRIVRRSYRPEPQVSDLVLKGADGTVREVAREQLLKIDMGAVPEGLLTRPTLVWKLRSAKAGRNDMRVSYLTEGMSWHANYTAVLTSEGTLDLSGWVTITNQCGTTFPNAELKLIAGDVNRVVDESELMYDGAPASVVSQSRGNDKGQGFEEKAFFEYHLYTLQGKTTLKDKQTKQIKLLDARGVKFVKKYVVEYAQGIDDEVAVEISFKNEKAVGLGMPLPKGNVRVQAPDSDGEVQEICQNDIDHTAKDEELKLGAGFATDIAAERTQTDFRQVGNQNFTTYEVKLRNHTDKPVSVVIRDHYYGRWLITNEDVTGKNADANTREWVVEVPANGEKVMRYTVRQN